MILRPETELLVESVLALIDVNSEPRALSIDTGFGCKTSSPGSYAQLSEALQIANGSDLPTLMLIDETDFNQWK